MTQIRLLMFYECINFLLVNISKAQGLLIVKVYPQPNGMLVNFVINLDLN